jgi:hypothetical protein
MKTRAFRHNRVEEPRCDAHQLENGGRLLHLLRGLQPPIDDPAQWTRNPAPGSPRWRVSPPVSGAAPMDNRWPSDQVESARIEFRIPSYADTKIWPVLKRSEKGVSSHFHRGVKMRFWPLRNGKSQRKILLRCDGESKWAFWLRREGYMDIEKLARRP